MKTQIAKSIRISKVQLIALGTVVVLLTGCATASKNSSLANRPAITRSSLPSEADIPLLTTLKTGYEQLRRTTTLVPTDRSNRIVQVAVHELGFGDRDSLIILVHGGLADSDTWRYVASELARDHDVWLVDLPGCGASDKPHPRWLEGDGYSPTALADRVLQAIAARLDARRTHAPPT